MNYSHHYLGDICVTIPGETAENSPEKEWVQIVEYHRRTKSRSRYGILRIAMFRNRPSVFPKLKGNFERAQTLNTGYIGDMGSCDEPIRSYAHRFTYMFKGLRSPG